jgi:hypothetical protein
MTSGAIVKAEEMKLVKELTDRQLAILTVKLLEPDRTLISIADELFENLSTGYKQQIVGDGTINKVLKQLKESPFLSGGLLAIKLMPISILTLNRLMLSSKKDNVRATSAKEIIRLSESAQRKIFSDNALGSEASALDELIESSNDSNESSRDSNE